MNGKFGESGSAGRLSWILGAFLAVHCCFWALGPWFFLPYYLLDTPEMIMVGKHWLLSTWKHPGMQGWIVEIISQITGEVTIAPYIAAQLAVAIGVWGLWKFAREFLSPTAALAAAVSMLTFIYFNYESLLYNNRTFLRAFEMLAIWWVYCAFKTNRIRYWILTGVILGAALYCKLMAFLLIIGIVSFMVVDPEARKYWRTPGPWVTTGICALLFLPFILWLFQNDFAPYKYAMNRAVGSPAPWYTHITYPLRFAFSQLGPLLPIFIALLPMTGMPWKWQRKKRSELEMKYRFLRFMLFFPLFAIIVISMVNGSMIRTALGDVIWLFFPVWLLCGLEYVKDTPKALRRVLSITAAEMVLMAAISVSVIHFSPMINGRGSRIHYPGPAIAAEVTKVWESHFDEPLEYVRGDDWPCMAVSLYGKSRPDVYSPLWMTDEEFRKKGGVLLWQLPVNGKCRSIQNFSNLDFFYTEENVPSPDWLAKFPNRIDLPPMEFSPQTRFAVLPEGVGIALVPPAVED
ncbi:MAG: glycosyltransferase family 39 protein [Thermoguttaceae bacterium]|nr:glycosyltransferase family 39 protein [Thermoguttaceae bacterium]